MLAICMTRTGGPEALEARELPLTQAAEAHRLIEGGHASGKIVLRID